MTVQDELGTPAIVPHTTIMVESGPMNGETPLLARSGSNSAGVDNSDDDDYDESDYEESAETVYNKAAGSIGAEVASDTLPLYHKQPSRSGILRQPPSWAWCAVIISLLFSGALFISGIVMLKGASTSEKVLTMAGAALPSNLTAAVEHPLAAPAAVRPLPAAAADGDKAKPTTSADDGQSTDSVDPLQGQRYKLDDFLTGTLSPSFKKLTWAATSQDGALVSRESNQIVVEYLHDQTRHVLADALIIKDPDGTMIGYSPFTVSADMEYIMFQTNTRQEWRHSSFSEFIIYRVADKHVRRLTASGKKGTTTYAKWSPQGHSVMFVRDNDLYVNMELEREQRITFDGSATVMNGVPDWIYEEEVFTSNFVCWWSPDARRIAYLRLDETAVPVYNMSMYVEQSPRQNAYPTEQQIRYPKPGYPNPIASLHVYDTKSQAPTEKAPVAAVSVAADKSFADADRLIVEVAWMGNDHLFLREMNRVQTISRLHLIDTQTSSTSLVREERGDQYKGMKAGWLDTRQVMRYIPADDGHPGDGGYVDLMTNDDGYDHLAYFETLAANKPTRWLTHGSWEVADGPAGIDLVDRVVYYMSTERDSTQRHLYSVTLEGENKKALTPDDGGRYEALFSPHAGWYVLNYRGPQVPSQTLYSSRDPNFKRVLNEFTPLKHTLKRYKLPTVRYSTIESDGYQLNVKEYLPPDFDPKEKYGVLFKVYGGPSSQLVDRNFRPGFEDALASDPALRLIVVTVDGRGTGFKGRAFRVGVHKQLGTLETIDQINAGRIWSKRPYVDPNRISIFGWSYGGYMAARVIEADSGVFKVGVSVAPVTDWHYYDSVYTERYMSTPQDNPSGYDETAVHKANGFRHARFLLVHGTGDDNVHFQQSAYLVNMLTEAGVDPAQYDLQYYPDNSHSMGQHGAYFAIWTRIITFLQRAMPVPATTAAAVATPAVSRG